MKRMFNMSIRRNANYQSVEISEGFEGEFESVKEYEANREALKKMVIEQVEKELMKLSETKKESTAQSSPASDNKIKKPIKLTV